MVGTRVVPRLVTKKVIEGRMKEIKKPGRPREMLLDWLTKRRMQNGLFTAKDDGRRQN